MALLLMNWWIFVSSRHPLLFNISDQFLTESTSEFGQLRSGVGFIVVQLLVQSRVGAADGLIKRLYVLFSVSPDVRSPNPAGGGENTSRSGGGYPSISEGL